MLSHILQVLCIHCCIAEHLSEVVHNVTAVEVADKDLAAVAFVVQDAAAALGAVGKLVEADMVVAEVGEEDTAVVEALAMVGVLLVGNVVLVDAVVEVVLSQSVLGQIQLAFDSLMDKQ